MGDEIDARKVFRVGQRIRLSEHGRRVLARRVGTPKEMGRVFRFSAQMPHAMYVRVDGNQTASIYRANLWEPDAPPAASDAAYGRAIRPLVEALLNAQGDTTADLKALGALFKAHAEHGGNDGR